MSKCKGCGTELKNCGAPIWEDYCPNKECHYEAEQFKSRMRKAGEEMRKKKALEAAAPELYAMLAQTAEYFSDADGLEEDEYIYRQNVRAALAKARGETV